jgi:hypothetical protein
MPEFRGDLRDYSPAQLFARRADRLTTDITDGTDKKSWSSIIGVIRDIRGFIA